MKQVQRFLGHTESVAFYEPVFIVYARELSALEAELDTMKGGKMKIQMLDRYEPKSEWHEIYANGDLLYEGELTITAFLRRFLLWLGERHDVEVEVRDIVVEYDGDPSEEYKAPVHAITGELYWDDWEKAK